MSFEDWLQRGFYLGCFCFFWMLLIVMGIGLYQKMVDEPDGKTTSMTAGGGCEREQ